MISERSQRVRKPKVIWEAAWDLAPCTQKNAIRKARRTVKKEALVPIPVEPIPAPIPRQLPSYRPPIRIRKMQGRPTFSSLSELQTFQKFFTTTIIGLVVAATNSYAARHRTNSASLHDRTWKDTTIGEIYRFNGVWLYIGMHQEAVREVFWSSTHKLGRYLLSHVSLREHHIVVRLPSRREIFACGTELSKPHQNVGKYYFGY